MAKFNLYEALKENGFHDSANPFGHMIVKKFVDERNMVSITGTPYTYKREMEVRATFSDDYSVVRVAYKENKHIFKTKTHLNDKRAYNAIRQTVQNNSFDWA